MKFKDAQEGITMTYEQTREEIAVYLNFKYTTVIWNKLAKFERESWLKQGEYILSLLFTPEEIEEWKKGGYPAIVCKDQGLPKCGRCNSGEYIGVNTQQKMIRDGFRRVKGVK